MHDDELGRQAAGVGMLADPLRRDLYRYVAAQSAPVSREQAARDLGIAHHTVKFHLDRLEEAGLLEVEFRRPPGRSGPGAGRPAKLYRRAAEEIAVSLPERRYDLAGVLMARAIDASSATGVPVTQALHDVAAAHGASLGREAVDRGAVGASSTEPGVPRESTEPGEPAEPCPTSVPDAAEAACGVLTRLGYEPVLRDGEITLANCPFHALVADHTDLVCGLNLALLDAVAGELGPDRLTARLDPAEGRCCVVLSVVDADGIVGPAVTAAPGDATGGRAACEPDRPTG